MAADSARGMENDGNVGKYVLPKNLSYDDIKDLDTDWINETIETGFKHEHDLSYRFGNSFVKSFIGVSYSKSDSYLKGNSFERVSGRGNFDFNLTNNLKATLSTSLSRGLVYRVPQAWNGAWGCTIQCTPYFSYLQKSISSIKQPI